MYYDSVRIGTDNNSTPHRRGGMPRLVSATDWFGATPNTGKLFAIINKDTRRDGKPSFCVYK